MGRPRILALNEFYLPGFKGGGSIRALVNVVGHLENDFDFVVATGDHDLNDPIPYPREAQRATIESEGYDIKYLPHGFNLIWEFKRLFQEHWDLIYFNGAFSFTFSILPLLVLRFFVRQKIPVVLAPRGEFMDGALRSSPLKHIKKRVFLWVARFFGHFSGVTFHATSIEEQEGILVIGLGQANILLAPDLPPRAGTEVPLGRHKAEGNLRMVFISRIDPKKNLHYALDVLGHVNANIEFDIVGPIANQGYWESCEHILARLPKNIKVRYIGAIPHTEILATFSQYDAFFFPTQAENNGYVILEAMLAGCPPLLSDRTPWRGLDELGVGKDLSLDDPDAFRAAIEDLAAMTPEAHFAMRKFAQDYGRERLFASADIDATRSMFLSTIL